MPESGSLQSVVEAAEQAAGAGDFAAAAQLLQQAVRLQESDLGPTHPDLANTLNNLGVVCERIGDWTEAERSYRRAAAIAASALPPEHPFVATSRQNLSDFCAMRGVPLDPASAAVSGTAAAGPVADFTTERQPFAESASQPQAAPASQRPAPAKTAPPAAVPRRPESSAAVSPSAATRPTAAEPVRSSFRGLTIAAILAIGAVVALIAFGPWSRSSGDGNSGPSSVTPENKPAAQVPPPAAPPRATAPQTVSPPAAPAGAPPKPAAAAPATSQAAKPTAGESAGITVVSAQLCRTLGFGGAEWTCTPPGAEVSAGPLYFYTRLKSPGDVVVRHRWYRGDQLRQAGDLKVGANTTAGYRTYSRHTVSGGPAAWRVELRTVDGRLLHEERFSVR